MIRLRLKPGREASVARRHPWLFSGALASASGDGSDGHAEIVDSRGRALARGSYSPESQIVARLWTFDGRLADASLFRERFEAARRLREASSRPRRPAFARSTPRATSVPASSSTSTARSPFSSS